MSLLRVSCVRLSRAAALAACASSFWQAASPAWAQDVAPAKPPSPAASSPGPHPDWLAGPDGPILSPKSFTPTPDFGAANAGRETCVAPKLPECAGDANPSRPDAALKTCEDQLEALVPKIFAYRKCLEAEASRTMRLFNDAFRAVKCSRSDPPPSCR